MYDDVSSIACYDITQVGEEHASLAGSPSLKDSGDRFI